MQLQLCSSQVTHIRFRNLLYPAIDTSELEFVVPVTSRHNIKDGGTVTGRHVLGKEPIRQRPGSGPRSRGQ